MATHPECQKTVLPGAPALVAGKSRDSDNEVCENYEWTINCISLLPANFSLLVISGGTSQNRIY